MSLIVLSVKEKAAGFTLIELVLTIVILGFSAIIIVPFFSAITHSPDPVLREKAIALGQAMMDEIMAKKWDENTAVGGGPICTDESGTGRGNGMYILTCPDLTKTASSLGLDVAESTTDRSDWNDVDDYDYYDSHPEVDTFYDQNNKPFSLPGYTRKVTVAYIASSSSIISHDLPIVSGNRTDTKRVVVTITSPLGETFYFVAVVCNI
jgi:MSHA pilin protein MshD